MKTVIMIAAVLFGFALQAQVTTGTIMGKVLDIDSAEVMPFAKVYVEYEGTKQGVMADAEGRYKIDGLKPGVYTVGATHASTGEMKISNVVISPDGITFLDVVMRNGNMLKPIEVPYVRPMIDKNLPRLTIPTEDIEHSIYIRDPKLMLTMSSDVRLPEGTSQIIIRGSRPGDAVYYIDGVKCDDLSAVPGVAIGSMEAYTGGIPAKYGDTTGGVVILETKSYFDLYNAWLAGQ